MKPQVSPIDNADEKAIFFSHIEGLRGLAIFLILCFHLSMNNCNMEYTPFTNGYLGVEVFNTIMGYLFLRGLIHQKAQNVSHLVWKKTCRIILPLAIFIFPVIIISLLMLDYSQITSSARTAFFALIGLSNMELTHTYSNYFSSDASYNLFLHTWYTSLALQFFVVGYICYCILSKVNKRCVVTMLFIICMFSLVFNQKEEIIDILKNTGIPSCIYKHLTSYYGFIPRMWEFLVGCSILCFPTFKNKTLVNIIACTGFILIIIPLFTTMGFIAGILVVIGCALTIKYAHLSLVSHILNFTLIRNLGKISFAVFIVHQPIIAIYRGFFFNSPNIAGCVILVIIILISSYLLWLFVEKRSYRSLMAVICIVLSLATSLLFWRTHGMKAVIVRQVDDITFSKYSDFRTTNDHLLLKGYDQQKIPYRAAWRVIDSKPDGIVHTQRYPFTILGSGIHPNYILIGDSHAHMYIPGLDVLSKKHQLSGIAVNALILPFKDRKYTCADSSFCLDEAKYNAFFNWIEQHPELKTVIIAFSYYWIENELRHTWEGRDIGVNPHETTKCIRPFLQRLVALNKNVIIYGPLPRFKSNNVIPYVKAQQTRTWLKNSNSEFQCSKEEFRQRWGAIVQELRAMEEEKLCTIVDPTISIFKGGVCYTNTERQIHFFDCNHISADLSIEIARSLEPVLVPLLKEDAASNRN